MRRPDEPDAEPTSAATPDDEARLDLIFRDHGPRLRRRIKAQIWSNEEAHDLVQDAFARLLGSTARHALRQPEAFLNRIVRNLLVDRSRRLSNRALHVPLDDANLPSTRPTQADEIELAQMRERYMAAVGALPDRMRTVFLLHRIDGLGYKEIAARLGISGRTVEWHVAEAILRIGRDLKE